MIVFPAVDIKNGKCVRLLQGKPDSEKQYYEHPWEAAQHWEELGAKVLHVVDLDGALGSAEANTSYVEEILRTVHIPVQVGGGLRTRRQVEAVLAAGAARAIIGTRVLLEPHWAADLSRSYPGRVIVALDARDGKVALRGWQELGAKGVCELAVELQQVRPAAFLYTDVDRDGMLSRPNFEGTAALIEATDVPVIASGGVASEEDVRQLGEIGADAVIIGKALYEGKLHLRAALGAASRFPSRLCAAPPGFRNERG